MADLAVTNTFVSGASITAAGHNTNFSDVVTYINNRNGGTDTWSFVKVSSTNGNPVDIVSSASTTELSLDNTATTGDPMVTWNLSGVAKFAMGVDDSDSDAFILAASGALGTTNILRALSSGVAILGTNTNNNASTGYVGESVRSLETTDTAAGTTTEFKDYTSISLTAGDWLVSGLLRWSLAGATQTVAGMAISINSNNTTTDHVLSDNDVRGLPPTSATSIVFTIPNYRLSLSATTTVYLKGVATFSAGTPEMVDGRISAVRIR